MTGFAAVPLADEAQDDRGRRWAGVARVVGPAWTRLPSLTVGLFGVQMLWSVEMSYGSVSATHLGTATDVIQPRRICSRSASQNRSWQSSFSRDHSRASSCSP